MAQPRLPAREAARPKGDGFWIDHAEIVEADISWLGRAPRLTLWNVTLPPGFLARLPNLWWLDIRGGTSVALDAVRGTRGLKYLAINQVRGMADLSEIDSLSQLRFLDLYGLAKVSHLPSLMNLKALARVELGKMKTLTSLAPALDAPNLRELHLRRTMNVSQSDVERILAHPTLEKFGWLAEDVPLRVWEPVMKQVTLPRTQSMHPEDWFT